MKINLSIGIEKNSNYIETFLTQMGVHFVTLDSIDDGVKLGIRVFFWGNSDLDVMEELFEDYDIYIITNFIQFRIQFDLTNEITSKSSYYFAVESDELINSRSFYFETEVSILEEFKFSKSIGKFYDTCNEVIPNCSIRILDESKIKYIVLPFNMWKINIGDTWDYRPYYMSKMDIHFVEVGPKIDFGFLRNLLFDILLLVFETLGVPLIVRNKLNNLENTFGVRIDADGFSYESSEAVLSIANQLDSQFTWFLDMQNWVCESTYIEKLSSCGQDIQLHCYYHNTFQNYWMNRINTLKGINSMKRNNITVKGICSPYGYYNDKYQNVLKKYQLGYSSEFGYNVDDLPSYPDNDLNGVLQIPVIPISVGTAGFNDAKSIDYFKHLYKYVKHKCKNGEIPILYDHPLNRMENYSEEYLKLFMKLKNEGYKILSMSEINKLWKENCNSNYEHELILESSTVSLRGFNSKDRLLFYGNGISYTLAGIDKNQVTYFEKRVINYEFNRFKYPDKTTLKIIDDKKKLINIRKDLKVIRNIIVSYILSILKIKKNSGFTKLFRRKRID